MATRHDRQSGEVERNEGAGRPRSGDDGLRRVFFEGLTSMIAIVTFITQPFAQESMRAMFGLPAWLPIIIALGVSALLAVYRLLTIQTSDLRQFAICVPLLACVIFSGYASGNNVIFYTMEGYTKDKGPTAEGRLSALTAERDILKQQLDGAKGVIGTLRQTLGLPPAEDKPSSSRSVPSRWLGFFGVAPAHAQTGRVTPDAAKLRQLEEVLKKFEADSRKLTNQLEKVKQDDRGAAASPKPLIKSW